MIEVGKEYRQRGGAEAKVFMIAGHGSYPVIGAYAATDGQWYPGSWRADGTLGGGESKCDLVEVKPRFRLERWVNVFKNGDASLNIGTTMRHPKENVSVGALARVRVVIEGEEGQFDE